MFYGLIIFPRTREVKKKSEKPSKTPERGEKRRLFRTGFILNGFAGRNIDHIDTLPYNCKEYFLHMY